MQVFQGNLGLEVLVIDDERMIGIFKLPTGQLFEVFGPGNRYQKLMNGPAIAFDVDDIDRAHAELEAKGVKFVSEIERPDGYLYQLVQRSGKRFSFVFVARPSRSKDRLKSACGFTTVQNNLE
jgi:hypothetical protein